jgi:hypothetical protein
MFINSEAILVNVYLTHHNTCNSQCRVDCRCTSAVRQGGRNGGIIRCQRESIGVRRRRRQHLHEQDDHRRGNHLYADIIVTGIPFRKVRQFIDHVVQVCHKGHSPEADNAATVAGTGTGIQAVATGPAAACICSGTGGPEKVGRESIYY